MEDYKEKDFTKEPIENLGKFGVHPLNEDGKELYVSKDFYNYHFLRKKDPELLKEVEEKMKKDREEELRKLQEVYKREEKKRKQAMGIFDDDEEEVKEEEKVIEETPIIKEEKKKIKTEKKGYNGPWPYPINYTNKKTLHNHYLDKKSVKKNISKKEPIKGVAAIKGSEKNLIMKEKNNNVIIPKVSEIYSGHNIIKEYDSSEVNTF